MWNGWIAPWLNRMIKSQISAKLGLLHPPGIENIELAEFKLGSIPPYFKTVRVYPGTTDKVNIPSMCP
jgi:Ca2+-dependent lipid-binding protein